VNSSGAANGRKKRKSYALIHSICVFQTHTHTKTQMLSIQMVRPILPPFFSFSNSRFASEIGGFSFFQKDPFEKVPFLRLGRTFCLITARARTKKGGEFGSLRFPRMRPRADKGSLQKGYSKREYDSIRLGDFSVRSFFPPPQPGPASRDVERFLSRTTTMPSSPPPFIALRS